MYGYIYKTTNLVNGKIYIGQHKSKKFDINYFGSGKLILNAIKNYGINNFKCEIIEWCDSQSQTNSRERYWINKYNSRDKKIGYNITEGGEGWKGGCHSEQTKNKISKSKTGCKPNRDYKLIKDDTKLKISNSLKEYYKTHDNPRKGVHLSDETKEKLSKINKGKKYSYETRLKHMGKIPWNKGVHMTEDAKRHLSEINTGKVVKRKLVGQYKNDILIATYISCTDASRKTGICRTQITKCCLGYKKTAKNFVFKYLE